MLLHFFFFPVFLTLNITDQFSLSLGFSCCPFLSVPHQQWELKKEEIGEKNVEGKPHNFYCDEIWLV